MSKLKLPPAPPPPNLVSVGHAHIKLEWFDIHERLAEAVSGLLGSSERITSEILMQDSKRSTQWRRMYIGYATDFMTEEAEPQKTYLFRLRFRIKDEWCPASEVLKVTTQSEPVNGEDIHRAVRSNNVSTLAKLLEENRVNIDVHDSLGFTPLMVAAQRSMLEIMELLMQKGANLSETTESGKSALMLASFKGEYDAIDLLLNSGANVVQRDKSGMTALHYAVDGESLKAIRRLVATDNIDVNITDNVMEWSPLLRCAGLKSNGNMNLAKELIKMGADVNYQDREGNTALHMALLNGHVQLIDLLLRNNANFQLANKMGNTAVKLAQYNDNLTIKELFFPSQVE